jgi:hypothetical protein
LVGARKKGRTVERTAEVAERQLEHRRRASRMASSDAVERIRALQERLRQIQSMEFPKSPTMNATLRVATPIADPPPPPPHPHPPLRSPPPLSPPLSVVGESKYDYGNKDWTGDWRGAETRRAYTLAYSHTTPAPEPVSTEALASPRATAAELRTRRQVAGLQRTQQILRSQTEVLSELLSDLDLSPASRTAAEQQREEKAPLERLESLREELVKTEQSLPAPGYVGRYPSPNPCRIKVPFGTRVDPLHGQFPPTRVVLLTTLLRLRKEEGFLLYFSLTRAPLPLIRYYLHRLLRCVVVLQVKPPNSKRTLPRRWKRVRAASWMATTRHRKKRRCTSACLPRRRSRLFARSGAWRGRPGNSGGPEKPSSSRAGAAGSRSANDGDGSTTSRW